MSLSVMSRWLLVSTVEYIIFYFEILDDLNLVLQSNKKASMYLGFLAIIVNN